jgi:hypothetical protein
MADATATCSLDAPVQQPSVRSQRAGLGADGQCPSYRSAWPSNPSTLVTSTTAGWHCRHPCWTAVASRAAGLSKSDHPACRHCGSAVRDGQVGRFWKSVDRIVDTRMASPACVSSHGVANALDEQTCVDTFRIGSASASLEVLQLQAPLGVGRAAAPNRTNPCHQVEINGVVHKQASIVLNQSQCPETCFKRSCRLRLLSLVALAEERELLDRTLAPSP